MSRGAETAFYLEKNLLPVPTTPMLAWPLPLFRSDLGPGRSHSLESEQATRGHWKSAQPVQHIGKVTLGQICGRGSSGLEQKIPMDLGPLVHLPGGKGSAPGRPWQSKLSES